MISNLASVSSNAQLGEGVIVESFTTIYEDVRIGRNTKIGPNVWYKFSRDKKIKL